MLSHFQHSVSCLYKDWKDCLIQSLKRWDKIYFESICLKTATRSELKMSLYKLSHFVAEKFGREVIVLIDEHDTPFNRAYRYGYFDEVRSFISLSMTVKVKDKSSRLICFSGTAYFLFS